MTLGLPMRTDDESVLSNDGTPFLMTPAQHRLEVQRMREAGREDLAQTFDNLARLIEARRRRMH